MSAKDVKFGDSARTQMLDGVKQIGKNALGTCLLYTSDAADE